MMKHISIAAALATAAVTVSPASAQSFHGPYVGVQAGWSEDDIGRENTKLGTVNLHESRDSFTGGAFAGYDYQFKNNIVLGVEAGFDVAADDASRGCGAVIDPDYSFDVGARAGYVFGGKTLVYIRGSYENTRARIATTGSDGIRSRHDNFDGWGIGGGVERFVQKDLSARVEYRYADFGDGGKFDRHQALVGVSYHF